MQTHNSGCPRIDSSRTSKKTGRQSYILMLYMIIIMLPASSQNLVPNPGFELANCPTGYTGAPAQVATWMQNWYSANCASPDPMTNCSTNANTSIPDVWFGSQYARTGTNYMGVAFYSGWYEYIGVQLTQVLTAGDTYNVSFWVSCADQVRYASDAVGIYFSTTQIKCASGFSGPVLSYTPQVIQTPGVFLTDSVHWTQVSGTYTAVGGEQYIVFGCFKPWNITNLYDFTTGNARCYYFVDDFLVEKLVALPVELIAFDAVMKENKEVVLNWKTASETNACSYEIQRSDNAINFEALGSISAGTNENTISEYHYTDRQLLKGMSYYRLKQTDCNGKSVYSKIISVQISELKITVFPNPVQDELIVSFKEKTPRALHISLSNMMGEIIYSNIMDGSDNIIIPFSNYDKGIYTLMIDSEKSKTIYQKIIK